MPDATSGNPMGNSVQGDEIAFNSQAAGDTFYATSATAATRLAIGTEGQFMKVVSGIPGWGTFSGLRQVATAAVAGAAAQTLQVTGLDLNTAGMYLVQVDLLWATGTPTVSFYVNSDSTAGNYDKGQITTDFTSLTTSEAANASINSIALSTTFPYLSAYILLQVNASGYPHAYILANNWSATAIGNAFQLMTWTHNSSTNVTTLEIVSTVAASLAIGSKITVFGL